MRKEEYENCKLQLNKYRDTVRKLNRNKEEIKRWNELNINGNTQILQTEIDALAKESMQLRLNLSNALELISPSEQDLIASIYLCGKTMEQLATQYQVTVRTINRRLHSAILHLKNSTDFFVN